MHLAQIRRDPHGRANWKKLCLSKGIPFIVVHRRQTGCQVEWEGVAELGRLEAVIAEGDAEYTTEGGKVRGLTAEAAKALAERLSQVLKAPATV